jgi:hypothetical protein
MKNKILLAALFLNSFITTSQAAVVVYDEGVKTRAFTIQAGEKNLPDDILLWNCATDKWVKNIDTDCTRVKQAMPISQIRELVKKITLDFAQARPHEALLPFKNDEMTNILNASQFIADPSHQNTSSDLSVAQTKLANAQEFVDHVPNSAIYKKQRDDAQIEVNHSSALTQQMAEAQQTLAEAEPVYSDVTDSLVAFIRQQAKDGSPQTIMSKMMSNTLLLAVLHRLEREEPTAPQFPAKIDLNFANQHLIVNADDNKVMSVEYPGALASTPSGRVMICNPVALATENNIFVAVIFEDGGVMLYEQGAAHNEFLQLSNRFGIVDLESITQDNRNLHLIGRTSDGTEYEQVIHLTKGKNENPENYGPGFWKQLF